MEEVELDRLGDVLSQEFWNFNLGYREFDGFSEGVNILGGLVPELCNSSTEHGRLVEYGPAFLPGARERYLRQISCGRIDLFDVRNQINMDLERLAALPLKGLVKPQEAIKISYKFRLPPPWLNQAGEDLACARVLPPNLRFNDHIRAQLKSEVGRNGGNARANKDAKTHLIREMGKPVFDELKRKAFKGYLFEASGAPNATKIADQVYHRMCEGLPDDDPAIPGIPAVVANVRRWLQAENLIQPKSD